MTTENHYQTPDSDLNIDQTESLVYAGFWIRVAASIIDTLIVSALIYPLLTVIYGSEYWFSESFIKGIWDLLLTYILPLIAAVLFWQYKSATPGKMALGLKIISLGDTETLSVKQSIGRYLAYYLSLFFMLGYIWVAFDPRKQGWHDKLANTAVIVVRKS